MPGGPPPEHIAPKKTKNTRFILIWDIWGIFSKKVELQGKSAQTLCNEPNNVPPNFGSPNITCRKETRVSKLKISQNHAIFTFF